MGFTRTFEKGALDAQLTVEQNALLRAGLEYCAAAGKLWPECSPALANHAAASAAPGAHTTGHTLANNA